MAIETITSHVLTALEKKAKASDLWVAFGGTTAWNNEENPPAEDSTTTDITNIVGFKKIETAQLVVPVDDSTEVTDSIITYRAQRYQIVSDDDAVTKGARYLYLTTSVNMNELPSMVYRQVGIYQGVVTNDSSSTKTALLPTDVNSNGYLLEYENRKFQRYDENIMLSERIMLKF